jgi:NADPH-dependent curcumin reductase CurA
MSNHGVGVVIRSEHQDFKTGDHVTSPGFCLFYYFLQLCEARLNTFVLVFQEYIVAKSGFERFYKIPDTNKLPWSLYVGVLGMPSHQENLTKLYSSI